VSPLHLAITVALLVLLAPLTVSWSLWCLFALLALLPARRYAGSVPGSTKIDILIPAHDEQVLLPRLLATLSSQSAAGRARIGRTLVVADHCSDNTAALARQSSAEVLERQSGPRGKPAALRDGLSILNAADNDRAVLILDADCTVSENLLESLAAALDAGHPVVQATYILDSASPKAGQKLHTPAMIAFALKNLTRPKGMARLGLPTQLFGTGMCFRADVLHRISFEDHLTEDLKISHDLLLAGTRPVFIADALVRSPLPEERSAMSTQKLRWETGQIQTWAKLPGMLLRLLARARFASALSLIDWSAPPVAIAIAAWLGLTFFAILMAALHLTSSLILLPFAITLCLLVTYVILGTAQIAGPAAVVSLFAGVPRFLLWKMALYLRMLTGRGAKTWDRTPRDTTPPTATPTPPTVVHQGEP
jgi:cellulose synthase/poly-beta-1,6-N-acetylglucosamine synthase-like glycosyltransferase